MLFVHGSLAIGGIETFYVRMAQSRKKHGLITKFLILSSEGKSNPELVRRARECADVYFLDELIFSPFPLPASAVIYQLSLLYPLRRSILKNLFEGITSAHVSNGFCAHVVVRMTSMLRKDLPLSIGLYHSMEFCWGQRLKKLPFFERSNREFFYRLHKDRALIFFNERMVDIYSNVSGKDFSGVNLFPLGVVDRLAEVPLKSFTNHLSIGSVGRLVDFKTYNLWMLDVVNELRNLGITVSYNIYGDGPIRDAVADKIRSLNLDDIVFLRGNFDYSEFSNIVSDFDVFVGSGTALIEAAGLGVPSIVGIESSNEALTYGFLSEIPGFSYNEDNLYPKKDVLKVLVDFNSSQDLEKLALSKAHVKKSEMFSIDTCVSNFERVKPSVILDSILRLKSSLMFRFLYTGSVALYSVSLKFRGKSLSQVVSSSE